MNCFGQKNDCLGGSHAVIGRKRDVALAIVKRRYSCDISFATFFLLAAHRLGRFAKRGASQTRLADIHQRPRSCQRFIDDNVDIGLCLPPGDLSFVDVDRVANRLFHAFKIEVPVTRDLLRHFVNEPLSYVASARYLFAIRLHEQIENRQCKRYAWRDRRGW